MLTALQRGAASMATRTAGRTAIRRCPALIRSAPLSAVQSHARRAASTQQAPSSSSSRSPAFPSQAEKERAKEEEEEDEEDEEDEKESQRQVQPFTWGSVAFMTLVGGGSLVYFLYEQDKQLNTIRTESIGTPLIGGPWSLIDDKGERVTSASLAGKYVMLYFGFTFCPDICPKELDRMDEVMKKFQALHTDQTLVPIFVSLDPKRDTPARLAEYKKKWNPNLLWLTGTDEELKATARAFRIYYSSSEVTPGADDDYLIDHSIFFYLMDRDGQFLEYFGTGHTPEDIVAKIATVINAENKRK